MIKKILDYVFEWITSKDESDAVSMALFVGVACFFAECISNPKGAINSFMCHFIDIIVVALPSTPSGLKINSLISSYSGAFGTALIADLVSTALSILSIYLVVKLYKFLPFT